MAIQKNIGKNTIGDNNKMSVSLHDYNMSTHDLSTTEKFPTREAAEKRINSVDWNLVASMIYACKEADEYEKKTQTLCKKSYKRNY